MTLQLERPDPQSEPPGSGPPAGYNTVLIAVAAVAGLVLVALAAYLVARDGSDGGFEIGDDATTTSTTETATSATASATTGSGASSSTAATSASTSTETTGAPTTSTTTATGSTSPTTAGQPARDVVWPDPGRTTGFDTPQDAANGFAVDLAGFREPVIGEFRAGDARSGEIEIRPSPTGPVTVVLLRQVTGDDSWWVIGAVSDDIVVDRPRAGDAVDGTLALAGRARAFEGHVTVAVYRHGDAEPLAESFVTGRGDGVLGPFETEIDVHPTAPGPGVVVLVAPSAEDGSAWAVTAVPVRLN